MKKTLIRIIFLATLLLASASKPVSADGGNPRPPFCPDGTTNCVN